MTKGGTYTSPPCMAGEVCPSYFDPLGVHPGQARDVARLPTIFPQPHDIPLDLILTEDGSAATRPDSRTHR